MGTRETGNPKREERAHRILDAASALILRWGYDKTTIDDIARQAGVAKGTIYLHWKTREDMFAALIRRERLAYARDYRQRIGADPGGATVRGVIKYSALASMKHPLLKALSLGNKEVLGKFSQAAIASSSFSERVEGGEAFLQSLREHGLVRTDLSLRAEAFIWGVVYAGFFLAAPMMPEELALSDEEVADLMAETIHRTLETDRVVSPEVLKSLSDAYIGSVDRFIALEEEQLRQDFMRKA